jgi:formylmethanofuran dehydrogenase subunit D
MTLLLNQRGSEVKITEEVVKAAAGNWNKGKEVMALLLDQRGDEVKITEEVVKAAAGNWRSGKEVIALLLDQRSDRIIVTPQLVQALAKLFDALAMKKLLMQRGDEVKITKEVVKAAAGNGSSGKKVMALLLDQRGGEIKITEEVVKAAAGNLGSEEVMALLLDQRGDEVKITEEVVKAAARNGSSGKEVMALLLDQRGDEVKITEEVVKAAAGNGSSGKDVMRLLLDRRGAAVLVTERVLYAAATSGNEENLLLIEEKCGVDIRASSLTLICRLFRSVRAGDKESVSELLALGVDPNHKDIFGGSPLWYSSQLGHVPVVCLLLQRIGIELDSQSNVSGFTAIMVAANSGHQKVVELLLDAGANPNIQDNNGRILLTIAQSKGLGRIVKILQSLKENFGNEPKQEAGECESRLV